MKKFLLSLLAVLTSTFAFADTWTLATEVNVGDEVVLAYTTSTVSKEFSGIKSGKTPIGDVADFEDGVGGLVPLTVVEGSTSGSVAFKLEDGTYLSWESGNSLTTSEDVENKSSWTLSFSSSTGKWEVANVGTTARKLQYNASSPRFCCYTGSQQPVDFYVKAAEGAVAKPVITPSTGTYFVAQTVTITAEEGVEVYYTINGGSETLYEAPFTVSENAEIVAYAVSASAVALLKSDEAKVTLSFAEPYTDIAEVNEAATIDRTTVGIRANEWLVTYVNGQYNYLTDGKAGLLLYSPNLGLEKGQKVSGLITGQLYTYHNLPEVANVNIDALEVVSEDNEVAPIVVASAALAADKMKWINMFIQVDKATPEEDVETEGAKAESFSFFSDNVEVIVRNQFKLAIDAAADQQYSIRGMLGIFDDNTQLYPVEIEEYTDPATIVGDVTEYYIANPSFELADAGKKLASELLFANGAGTIYGWFMEGVGTQFNNTEVRAANSSSSTSQFGTSDPSDGDYSLFFRQGWNGDGNTITLTASSTTELPAGNYILSVDYKQHYSYDNKTSQNTKVGIACKFQSETLGEKISEAAAGVQGASGDATYFSTSEWSTIETPVALSESRIVDFVVTLYSGGQRRSDFFVDNVRLERVSEEVVARAELEAVLAEANELLEAPAGNLFMRSQEDKNALQEATEEAQEVYDDETATAEAIRNQVNVLTAAVTAFVDAELIAPDPDALYTIKLKDTELYMTLSDKTKLSAEPQGFILEQTENGYAITDGEGNYVAQAGANSWNMDNSTTSFSWTFNPLPDGSYSIAQASANTKLIGVDATEEDAPCYANKALNEKAMWIIEEMPKEGVVEVFTATTARGAWMYDAANNRMHYNASGLPDELTDDYKFALVEKYGKQYLYSLGAGKFVQPQKYFVEGIPSPVKVEEHEGYVMVKSANSPLTMNIGGQWTWDTWTSADDGNKVTIEPVGDFDATEALAMLENGAIDSHKVFTVTTERGQWAASADGNSLASLKTNANASDADKQFAFYYNEGDLYIYSVGAKKFFKYNNGSCSFFAGKGDPVDYRIVATSGYDHCFFFTDNSCYFNMQDAGGYAINTWYVPDPGNKQELAAVEGVDVYDEMEEVFNTVLVDVEYQVVYNGKTVATATATNAVGKPAQLPAELDNELCTFTLDVETIAEDTKVVKATAEWNGPFEFSESVDDAKWYNMKIRTNYWVSTLNADGEETEPYYPTADKDLSANESQWAFVGDPFNVVVYNRAHGSSSSLKPDNGNVVLRDGEYAWDIFGNGDGFVLREKATANNYVNQAGGATGPLGFWNSAAGRRDDGSTLRVEEVEDIVVLDGIAALKSFDGEGDVVLHLDNAKVTFVGTSESTDWDTWESIVVDNVVIEDATAGNLFQGLGFGDYVKEGDVITGDIHLTVESYLGEAMISANEKTAADLEKLAIVAGTAEPLAVNDDNVLDYAANFEWIYSSFEGATISVEEGYYGDDYYVYIPSLDDKFGILDILGALPQDVVLEDGQTVDVTGYLFNYYGILTAFQPIAFGSKPLELAVDVDYYKGQNGLNYEADFTEALEYLGIEDIAEATIVGVNVTTDAEVEDYLNYDGWRNADGDYQFWGDDAAVCVKFANEGEKFAIYDMGNDNVPEVGETFVARFHISANGKTVIYNVNVNFVDEPVKYLADYTEKGSFDLTILAAEKGVAFDGLDSETFEEAAISELIGEEWSEIYGKGAADEIGETLATKYSCDPAPGFWCLEDGVADVYANGSFGVSLIPSEDWSTLNFRAWTKEALEENVKTTFYFVNEETKEYVAYNVTLSAKPAVTIAGTFEGVIKQILSHPQTGKQGEATGEQTVTIAEGEEEGTYDITFSGFTMPVTGAVLPEFTITGVEAELNEDGTAANYVLPAWAPQSITIDRGTGSVTYQIALEGTKEGDEAPVLKLTLDNSVVDDVYFAVDEETLNKAIEEDEATAIRGINGLDNAASIFDLSGRKVEKVQKGGIYIVNGKKVSVK